MKERAGLAPQAGPVSSSSPLHWPAKRISILLTVIALILWSYSITQARFEIGFYGLLGGFPPSFFLALGVLTISSAILWLSKEDHGKLLFLQLFFLVVSIWLAPIMVRGAQPFLSDAYGDLGYIEYIIRTGHFNQAAVWQHNWPIAWIVWVMGIKVSGTSMDGFASFIAWIPFIWQCVMFFPVFVFFRNTIGKANPNYCWAAMWLFYLGYWFESQNTGGQAFGVFFLFSVLALLTMTPYWQQRAGTFGHRFSAIVLFAVSAIAHLLGSFMTLGATVAMYASKRMRSSNLIVFAAVLIGAWSIYGAADYFEWHLPALLRGGFHLSSATKAGVLSPLSSSASHAAVARVRIVFSGLFVGIAVLGALMAWRLRQITHDDITVLVIPIGYGIVAVAVGAGYGVELYQRVFVFLLPPIAYFGVKLLRLRTTAVVLCLLLLIALPFAFISKYGNQSIDYLSSGHLSGASFFQDNTARGYLVGGSPMGSMKYYERYGRDVSFEDLEWQDNELVRFGFLGFSDTAPRYVCISDHDRAMQDFYYNEPKLIDEVETSLNAATNCNLVYANPDLSLYIRET